MRGSIIIGHLPSAADAPGGESTPTAVDSLDHEDGFLEGVVGDGDLVGLVGLECQFDRRSVELLGIAVATVGSSHADIPVAVFLRGAGLNVLSPNICLRVGDGALCLLQSDGRRTGEPIVGIGFNCNGTGVLTGAAGSCGRRENKAGDQGECDQKQTGDSFQHMSFLQK